MCNLSLYSKSYSSNFYSLRESALVNFFEMKNNTKSEHEIEKKALSNLENISEEKFELLLRKIFDLSREFGLKILAESETLDLEKISGILNLLEIPCIEESFVYDEKNNSAKSIRNNCLCSANEKSCQYWRESIDGLIMGLGDNERYVRHSSILYGKNDNCTDVIYDSSLNDMRWGEIPLEILNSLNNVIEKYQKKDIQIILKGFNEKTLYFQIKDKDTNLSGFRRKFILENMEATFNKKFPDFNLFEISPRAVIEGEF